MASEKNYYIHVIYEVREYTHKQINKPVYDSMGNEFDRMKCIPKFKSSYMESTDFPMPTDVNITFDCFDNVDNTAYFEERIKKENSYYDSDPYYGTGCYTCEKGFKEYNIISAKRVMQCE